ncbi:MAG: DNA polymerase III subunit chi [Methylococcaceae bacterium]|nr:DNA polymerase III subunit chi [Methylococcaceae bacterium]MCI0667596.1 DNA polymerase III subunit chi [Methylococcaceae bacterium]
MCCVDFYILDSSDPENRLRMACRLTEKAWHGGYRTFILTDTPIQQKTIDDLLWTFKPGSFVPHVLVQDRGRSGAPVVLGNSPDSEMNANLLINLRSSPVDPPEGVERIIEIVDQDEQVRLDGRQRYRYYQKTGKTVRSHRISD